MTLLLSALGGVLALDAIALGQFMVSRPLVAATIAGWILGDPFLGLQIGALLELFHIASLSSGGSRVADAGPASVAAVAVATSAAPGSAVALGVLAGLVTSELGGVTIGLQRRLNARLMGRLEEGPLTPGHLDAAHLAAMSMDFVRGAALTAAAQLGGGWLAQAVGPAWAPGRGPTIALLLLGASVHLGALLKAFGGWSVRRRLFMAGVVAGLAGAFLA